MHYLDFYSIILEEFSVYKDTTNELDFIDDNGKVISTSNFDNKFILHPIAKKICTAIYPKYSEADKMSANLKTYLPVTYQNKIISCYCLYCRYDQIEILTSSINKSIATHNEGTLDFSREDIIDFNLFEKSFCSDPLLAATPQIIKRKNVVPFVTDYDFKGFLFGINSSDKIIFSKSVVNDISHITSSDCFVENDFCFLKSEGLPSPILKDYLKSNFLGLYLIPLSNNLLSDKKRIVSLSNIIDGNTFEDNIINLFNHRSKFAPLLNYIDFPELYDQDLSHIASLRTQKTLYETFKLYVLSQCSVKSVADSLFVHRNTVMYRIKKIEEKLNISLKEPQNQYWVYSLYAIDSLLNNSNKNHL